MAFTLQDMKTAIGAGARSNIFEVTYSGGGLDGVAANFSFLTKAAALPSSTVGLIEVPFRGRRLKLAGDRVFNEWTATVINDESFAIRAALETHQSSFTDVDFEAISLGDRTAGRSTLTVSQLDAAGVAVRTYSLINCFASEIGTIDLSYDTTDTVEEYTVTWTYDYFTTSVA
jgi:hypothetical protein